jgi:hypothetical protein
MTHRSRIPPGPSGAIAFAAMLLCCALASEAWAQTLRRPPGASRLVASWDFERPEDQRDRLPLGWFRSVHQPDEGSHRPGFPPFNRAEGDAGAGVGRSFALRLETRGGNTSVLVVRDAIPVIPGSDYLITAKVRTQGLVHARARLGARLIGETVAGDTILREPLPNGVFVSEPVFSEEGWSTVQLHVDGRQDAAFVQLDLQVVQPERYDAAPLGAHRVRPEDFSGVAWFDDIRVYQVPSIRFATTEADNVVVAPDEPALELRVRDHTGERLRARMLVFDGAGALVDEHTLPLNSRGVVTERWTPALPRFGWYRAAVQIVSDRGVVGQRISPFVWLAKGPERDEADRRAFGVHLGTTPTAELESAPELLRELKTGAVWLDVWSRITTGEGRGAVEAARAASGALAGVVEQLVDDRHDVVFALDRAPAVAATADGASASDPLSVLASEKDDLWSEQLEPLLTRFGERITRWQIGRLGDDEPTRRATLQAELARVAQSLSRLVPRPELSTPWLANVRPPDLTSPAASVIVPVPTTLRPEGMAELVASLPESVEATFVLETLDPAVYGPTQRGRDLCRRAVAAWEAGARSLAIRTPWAHRSPARGGPAPDAAYPVWRTLAEELSDYRPVAELFVAEGARAIVAARQGDDAALIVAWNEWAPPDQAVLRGRFAEDALAVRDHEGNARVAEVEDGMHAVALTQTPRFITGVDLDLALFRAALRFEPSFLESRAQRHTVELVAENPWSVPIRLAIGFASPESWAFVPRVARATIPPGESVRLPVELTFDVGEASGRRVVEAEVLVIANREFPVQRVPLIVELGLEHIEVSTNYRYVNGPDGRPEDLIVSLLVANTGPRRIPLRTFLNAPGRAGQESLIPSLEPGEALVRRFVFTDAHELVGQRVRVSVLEVNDTGRINRWIELR